MSCHPFAAMQMRSLDDDMYGCISASSSTIGMSNCDASSVSTVGVSNSSSKQAESDPSLRDDDTKQFQHGSPVHVASFDTDVTPPPILRRSKPKDNDAYTPTKREVEPTTTAITPRQAAVRKLSSSARSSRSSVNMAGLQTSASRDNSTTPRNYNRSETMSQYSNPSEASTPPRRSGKRRTVPQQLAKVARTLEFGIQNHQNRQPMDSSVVVYDEESIELQVGNFEGVSPHQHDQQQRPQKMTRPQNRTSAPVETNEGNIELSFDEEVAMEYNEPKRLTQYLITGICLCILIMLTAILFALWFLIERRGELV